ncbi:MAG: hypothetical protein AMXMBFR64_02500 [Myxococcales bacterium]
MRFDRVWIGVLALALAACADEAVTGASGDADADATPAGDAGGIGEADVTGPDAGDVKGPACGKDGDPCEDGDPCTVGDTCSDDVCVAGAPMACDDGLACTTEACVGGACVATPTAGTCAIGGACYADGDADPQNPCAACDAGANAWAPVADGAACGGCGATCEAGVCVGETCDDGNPCTDDACEDGACVHTDNEATCDDGDACTTGDVCGGGACAGTAAGCTTDADCAGQFDACHEAYRCEACACVPDPASPVPPPPSLPEPCQAWSCDPQAGWVQGPAPDGEACDDGDVCTEADACAAGDCAGSAVVCDQGPLCGVAACEAGVGCVADTAPECDGCPVQRLTTIQFASGPGAALDVTGDGVPDNAFGPAAGLLNGPLAADVEAGTFTWLAQHAGLVGDGSTYTLTIHHGDPEDGCDPAVASCSYVVREISFTESCTPKFTFTDATVDGSHVSAGGAGTTVVARFTMIPNVIVEYTLHDVRIEADLAVAPGEGVDVLGGTIGGVVPMADIVASIEAVPDAQLPFPKEALLGMLAASVIPDVDLDGDGVADGVSFALLIEGAPSAITGVAGDVCPVCWTP